MCAKPCSGRFSTEKGLDMMERLAGGVPGELLTGCPPLLLIVVPGNMVSGALIQCFYYYIDINVLK